MPGENQGEPREPIGTMTDRQNVGEGSPADRSESEQRDEAIRAIEELEAQEKASESAKPDEDKTPADKPPATEEDPKYAKLATSYAQLERKLRQFEKETLPALQSKAEQHDALMRRMQDPAERYKAAEELGLDIREWNDEILKADEPPKTPEQKRFDALEERIAKLTDALENRDKQDAETKQQLDYQKRLNTAKEIVENTEGAVLTRGFDQSSYLLAKYQEMVDSGKSPSDEEVVMAVESELEQVLRGQLDALKSVEKFQGILKEYGFEYKQAPTRQEKDQKGTEIKPAKTADRSSTLTNDLSAEPSGDFDYSKASDKALRERAMKRAAEIDDAEKERLGLSVA